MCRTQFLIIFGVTIFGCQADESLSDDESDLLVSKKHLSTLARDGHLNGKRYVSPLINDVRPIYYPHRGKKFAHPFSVFQKEENPDEEKRYIGSLLAKSGPNKIVENEKRSLMDGIIFGEDMRQYLRNGNYDKREDSDFNASPEEYGGNEEKRSYGVDGLIFGEDLRKAYTEESDKDDDKRALPYPLLRGGKRMYGADGLVFGDDLRRLLLQHPSNDDKRSYNNLMDSLVFGEDLRNKVFTDNVDKRGQSLMDGMVFGEDLRNKILSNYYEKRGHGLMDGIVFAEDLRKAIQEASVRKDKEKQIQKLKDDKDLSGQKVYSKILPKSSGKRSLQSLARNGDLIKIIDDQGKRAGIEALARNGLLNGKQGKRAGLEALARNGYLNKCPNPKRGLSILAKNGLMPQKQNLNFKRGSPEDNSYDDNIYDDEDIWTKVYFAQKPFLPFVAKRPMLRHIPASSTTKNIPYIQTRVISPLKKNFISDLTVDSDSFPYELQKRYVATLLKEATSPAKINIRDAQKSIEEGATDENEEKSERNPTESKRDNHINDEYTMPVLQNGGSRNLEEIVNELSQLSHDTQKRYYAVKGGGRILGGRLQELGKHKQNQAGSRSWL